MCYNPVPKPPVQCSLKLAELFSLDAGQYKRIPRTSVPKGYGDSACGKRKETEEKKAQGRKETQGKIQAEDWFSTSSV